MQILVFGDSITYGAWDIEGGWVARLRRELDARQLKHPNEYYTVYNLGISGDTTTDLLKRFWQEATASYRIEDENESGEAMIIFDIGTNDFSVLSGVPKANYKEFEQNLRKLSKLAKKLAQRVIFIGRIPCDEEKTMPVSWDPNLCYNNKSSKECDLAIKKFCKANKLEFVDVFDKFAASNYKKLLEDGLHPNSKGHKLIFGLVNDYLKQTKTY
ncbi:MAG: hypothetical protein KGH49_02440 [Candidatus Micrarchaeota archaeon]|nr:hypothetical protein [Candidatus Micrarchaeota archaeon]